MAILSITFHSEAHTTPEWEQYLKTEILPQIETWQRKFILSEVETSMLSEGKNINLLIFFDNSTNRATFVENTLPHLSEKISVKFQEKVLVFVTFLNTIKSDF